MSILFAACHAEDDVTGQATKDAEVTSVLYVLDDADALPETTLQAASPFADVACRYRGRVMYLPRPSGRSECGAETAEPQRGALAQQLLSQIIHDVRYGHKDFIVLARAGAAEDVALSLQRQFAESVPPALKAAIQLEVKSALSTDEDSLQQEVQHALGADAAVFGEPNCAQVRLAVADSPVPKQLPAWPDQPLNLATFDPLPPVDQDIPLYPWLAPSQWDIADAYQGLRGWLDSPAGQATARAWRDHPRIYIGPGTDRTVFIPLTLDMPISVRVDIDAQVTAYNAVQHALLAASSDFDEGRAFFFMPSLPHHPPRSDIQAWRDHLISEAPDQRVLGMRVFAWWQRMMTQTNWEEKGHAGWLPLRQEGSFSGIDLFGQANYLLQKPAWQRLHEMAKAGDLIEVHPVDLGQPAAVAKLVEGLMPWQEGPRQTRLGLFDLDNVLPASEALKKNLAVVVDQLRPLADEHSMVAIDKVVAPHRYVYGWLRLAEFSKMPVPARRQCVENFNRLLSNEAHLRKVAGNFNTLVLAPMTCREVLSGIWRELPASP